MDSNNTKCPVVSCGYEALSVTSYLKHARIHDGQKTLLIPCPFSGCPFQYGLAKNLSRHVRSVHSKTKTKIGHSFQDEEMIFECKKDSCFNRTVCSVRDLKSHLLSHTDHGETVECPFKPCTKSYSIRSSMCNHFARCHKFATVLDLNARTTLEMTIDLTVETRVVEDCLVTDEQLDSSDSESDIIPLQKGFVGAIGDFYNVLMNEKRIPHSTTDFIVQKKLHCMSKI
jgi:hypothetical protein